MIEPISYRQEEQQLMVSRLGGSRRPPLSFVSRVKWWLLNLYYTGYMMYISRIKNLFQLSWCSYTLKKWNIHKNSVRWNSFIPTQLSMGIWWWWLFVSRIAGAWRRNIKSEALVFPSFFQSTKRRRYIIISILESDIHRYAGIKFRHSFGWECNFLECATNLRTVLGSFKVMMVWNYNPARQKLVFHDERSAASVPKSYINIIIIIHPK